MPGPESPASWWRQTILRKGGFLPEIKSYADVIRDWEKLLTSADERKEQLPNIEVFRQSMVEILAEAKAIKARQDSFTGDRQRASQELSEVILRGREVVGRLRQAIRAQIGLKNELLILFGVRPLRKRVRKPKTAPAPATPNPPAPTPANPADSKS